MAKKSKDTTTTTSKKEVHVDPVKTRNLSRLLTTLGTLLALTALLLQFFAVITHRWKWQETALRPIVNPNDQLTQSAGYEDARLHQRYGLFSRDVKLYAHNDEQMGAWASTRFPRIDDGEENFHHCVGQTGTLRGAFLTCSKRLNSPDNCHCRRYPHWNAFIFFEILALVLLVLLVIVCSLLRTHLHALLKPVAAALGFLAFLSMLIGLIILLSYLKRETRSIADIYPHAYHRFADKLGLASDPRQSYAHHQVVRRQTHETYRAYNLLPGQHAHNSTHYQEFSNALNTWVYKPYTERNVAPAPAPAAYVPRAQQNRPAQTTGVRRTSTAAPLQSGYGPNIGYDRVFDNTRAGIGWSTVLSILSMIPALLAPALLAYSWLLNKKLGPEVTTTTTTVRTEYVSTPRDVTVETVPLTRGIATDHDVHRPTGETVVSTHNVRPAYDNYSGRSDVAGGRSDIGGGRSDIGGGRSDVTGGRDDHQTGSHTYRT